MYVHTRDTPPPPVPSPPPLSGAHGVRLLFFSPFGVYTQVGIYVKCAACEFSANVECVSLVAVPPQLGLAGRVGRGPWLRAQSLAGMGWRPLPCGHRVKGQWWLPGSQVPGLDASAGPELLASGLCWATELQPGRP